MASPAAGFSEKGVRFLPQRKVKMSVLLPKVKQAPLLPLSLKCLLW